MDATNARSAPHPGLLILHGANGCRTEIFPWRDALRDRFNAQTINLAGHGGKQLPDAFNLQLFAEDVLAELDKAKLHKPVFLGYSFGGIVALYLARHYPDRVSGVITVATKWIYDDNAVRHITHLLQVPRLENIAVRAEHLQRAHYPNDWRVLAERLSAMFYGFAQEAPLTSDDLSQITCPVLVISGKSDPLAGREETISLRKHLPRGAMALYDGPAHPADRVPIDGLKAAITHWASGTRPLA